MSASPNPLKRAFCLAWLACLLIAAPVLADRLAVVSRSDNLVAFIDLESGEITSTVATGNNPHEMAADSNRRFAYVPAYGGNRIAKVDLANEALAEPRTVNPFVVLWRGLRRLLSEALNRCG